MFADSFVFIRIFYAKELEQLDLLKIGERKIRVNPIETKVEIGNKHEALAAIIILAKNSRRETFKERLKSVKEAYVQKQRTIEEAETKKKQEEKDKLKS